MIFNSVNIFSENIYIKMWIFLFILSIASSPLITRAAENSCKSDQWHCKDGACISLENVCDAVNDCSDGSDETLPFCRRLTPEPFTSCILPPYPAHGTYEVENLRDARPGQKLASFALTVRCRKGYGVMNPNGDGSGIQEVYCVNGKWHQDMPKCVRFCKLNPDPSVRYMCYYPGKGVEVCRQYVPSGMSVEPICNHPIYYSNELLPNMRCWSGVWNYIALCKAECGRVTPGGIQLAIGGINAKHGELPWHVGIYRKTTKPYTQICGGSIVSNNIVISAAHCFWTYLTKLLPAADFGVAGGNIYRPWDNEKDFGAQRSDVKEIKIPSLFEGEAANFQEDIAVITLMTPFNFTTYIRPVCLDFSVNFDRVQLQHGKLGKVAGWGLTAAQGQASEVLRVLEIPFIGIEICKSTLPETFREYITADKFCAGYTNGTALCQGDSGGGLAFSERERGVDRYFLRGIVSAAPKDEDKLCNDNVYTAFTKITKHQEFIKEAFAASARKTCPLYSFQCDDGSCVDPGADCNGRQDCADGSDESDELCRVTPSTATMLYMPITDQQTYQNYDKKIPVYQLIPNQTFSDQQNFTTETAKTIITQTPEQDSFPSNNRYGDTGHGDTMGDFPWTVAVYDISKSKYIFWGGTLISNKHVITSAYILPTSVNEILVQLKLNNGKLLLTTTVVSVSVHPEYNKENILNDIAILKLDKKVEFKANNITAAHLWNGYSEVSEIVGYQGYYVGWVTDTGSPVRLPMYVAKPDNCTVNNKTLKTFRTQSLSIGVAPGGGFYISNKGSWRLRGIYSKYFTCASDKKYMFTDVAQYLPWINSVLSKDSFQSNSRYSDTGHGDTMRDFPWTVAVYDISKSNYIFWGGTLISNKHVITSAHILPISVNEILVELKLNNGKLLLTTTVVSVSVHPEYNKESILNDIAILKLDKKVEFKANNITAAHLWNGYSEVSEIVGYQGYYVGWVTDTGSPVRLPMYVAKPVNCTVNNKTLKTFRTQSLSIGVAPGGGFYISNKGSWRLRGIYSIYFTCASDKKYMFTDVAQYLPWINSILSKN